MEKNKKGFYAGQNFEMGGRERTSMRITLDIPDGIICGFFNGVEQTENGLQLVSYQLGSDDFADGKTIKLPREWEEGAD